MREFYLKVDCPRAIGASNAVRLAVETARKIDKPVEVYDDKGNFVCRIKQDGTQNLILESEQTPN